MGKPRLKALAILACQCAVIVCGFGQTLYSPTQISPAQIKSPGPSAKQIIWYEFVGTQSPDGSYFLPVPIAPPGSNQNMVVIGPAIFRNNARANQGTDFTINPALGSFLPSTPWAPTDAVLIEYWAVVNGGPTQASPGVITLFAGAPLFTTPPAAARPVTTSSKPAGSRLIRFLTREYPSK
jgi:hypothetical protein